MTTQVRPTPAGGGGSAPFSLPALRQSMHAMTGLASGAPAAVRALWRDERTWLLVLIPFALMAASPLQWVWKYWADPNAPLAFQRYVPLGVAYLFWADRDLIRQRLREREVIHPVGSKRRHGTILVALAGCLLMLFAYPTLLTQAGMLGLLLAFAGALLYLYGALVFKSFARPLLFSLAMVPLPGAVLGILTGGLALGSARIAGSALRGVYPSAQVLGDRIVLGNYSAVVGGANSGAGVVLAVGALTLVVALARHLKPGQAAVLLACSAVISTAVNILRVLVVGLLGGINSGWANALHGASQWPFVALAFYLTLLVARRIGPRRRRGLE